MDKAYWIGRNISDGSGAIDWEPRLDDAVWARFNYTNSSASELKTFEAGVTLVTTRLVRGRVPEVMGMSIGPYIVAPALREFIEEIEPNVHNFYPVSIRTKKPVNGVSEHGTHWLLHPPLWLIASTLTTPFLRTMSKARSGLGPEKIGTTGGGGCEG